MADSDQPCAGVTSTVSPTASRQRQPSPQALRHRQTSSYRDNPHEPVQPSPRHKLIRFFVQLQWLSKRIKTHDSLIRDYLDVDFSDDSFIEGPVFDILRESHDIITEFDDLIDEGKDDLINNYPKSFVSKRDSSVQVGNWQQLPQSCDFGSTTNQPQKEFISIATTGTDNNDLSPSPSTTKCTTDNCTDMCKSFTDKLVYDLCKPTSLPSQGEHETVGLFLQGKFYQFLRDYGLDTVEYAKRLVMACLNNPQQSLRVRSFCDQYSGKENVRDFLKELSSAISISDTLIMFRSEDSIWERNKLTEIYSDWAHRLCQALPILLTSHDKDSVIRQVLLTMLFHETDEHIIRTLRKVLAYNNFTDYDQILEMAKTFDIEKGIHSVKFKNESSSSDVNVNPSSACVSSTALQTRKHHNRNAYYRRKNRSSSKGVLRNINQPKVTRHGHKLEISYCGLTMKNQEVIVNAMRHLHNFESSDRFNKVGYQLHDDVITHGNQPIWVDTVPR